MDSFNKRGYKEDALAQKTHLTYTNSMDKKLVLWRMIGYPELCRE